MLFGHETPFKDVDSGTLPKDQILLQPEQKV